jgi:26 proteasome complex subunit DSS1
LTAAESELPPTSGNGTNSSSNPTHLWEESWDDDDENEDFAKQLREELKKVEGGK